MKLLQPITQNFIIYLIHNKKQLFFYYNFNQNNKINIKNNNFYKKYSLNNTNIKTF
jgi:hypothetical protein